ncbi:hypothetical protein [Burkholderia sp. Ed8]|uniref:hypothetical protein n=1 Tax=Burkholderia sp. Ed8 TaxID=3112957 RepID=UPI00345DD983
MSITFANARAAVLAATPAAPPDFSREPTLATVSQPSYIRTKLNRRPFVSRTFSTSGTMGPAVLAATSGHQSR